MILLVSSRFTTLVSLSAPDNQTKRTARWQKVCGARRFIYAHGMARLQRGRGLDGRGQAWLPSFLFLPVRLASFLVFLPAFLPSFLLGFLPALPPAFLGGNGNFERGIPDRECSQAANTAIFNICWFCSLDFYLNFHAYCFT